MTATDDYTSPCHDIAPHSTHVWMKAIGRYQVTRRCPGTPNYEDNLFARTLSSRDTWRSRAETLRTHAQECGYMDPTLDWGKEPA